MLVDEVLTPDSSRFWPAEEWRPGGDQPSFDKQYLREWLLGLVRSGQWSKSPPGPPLPPEIVAATAARYAEARRRLWE
jgi:phosphoribosylaminoimidazole-succinocarboxamide synthase